MTPQAIETVSEVKKSVELLKLVLYLLAFLLLGYFGRDDLLKALEAIK